MPDDLDLLSHLATGSSESSFAELRAASGMPQATLTRALARLVERGYARRAGHGSYAAGPALLALGLLVAERAAPRSLLPLLRELAERTGLNAEAYALAPSGPVFLHAVDGRSEFRPPMRPGHRVQGIAASPAGWLWLHRHPEAFPRVAPQFAAAGLKDEAARRAIAAAARRGFVAVRGVPRPELARAAVPFGDGSFAVGVSALISEFPPPAQEDALRRLMTRIAVRHRPPAAKEVR